MDDNEFFRQATLRICGNLAIEKALEALLQFLRKTIPVDRLFLQKLDQDHKTMRTIAYATMTECGQMDLLTPLSEKARDLSSLSIPSHKRAYLFENPSSVPISREMLEFHGVRASSLIVIGFGKQMGSMVLISEGEEKFNFDHLKLVSLLNEPLAIALSNTLKHRSELKLYGRDFFWEITKRLCGNLEIEEGLHSCIEHLSLHMPADNICFEYYEEDLGAMRYVAWANAEKGERMNVLVPLSGQAKAKIAKDMQKVKDKPEPVFIINKPKDNPLTVALLKALGQPLSSILGIPLAVGGHFIGAVILTAEGDDRFSEDHAKLFATLKEPFFVAMSNALKHQQNMKLKDLLADDNRYLQGELRRISGDEIIGANFGLKNVMHKASQVAKLDSPVLLTGETGAGKDVIANAIHYSSTRSQGPFVSVNCGAIPEALIDSELFGHEKGAFTGAISQKRGRFERADKGTIFLDEVGELPPQAQVRLLRVLQNKEIERVGGVETIPLDIRIIAATNRNLEEMVKRGEFREDLRFRLDVFPISIPPLRERTIDIPSLVQHFITVKSRELKLPSIPKLFPGSMDYLMKYSWPGNVRELQNVIERALILNPKGPLHFEHMDTEPSKEPFMPPPLDEAPSNLDAVISQHIQRILTKTNGRVNGPKGAAALLGVNPSTLRNRMKRMGIEYGRKSRD